MAFQDRHGWSWRRLGVIALAAALAIAGHVVASPAHAAGKSAVLVIDANTGRVLHQSAADEPRHPASLAKMMTLYLTFELIEQGRLSYQTKIKISANAAAAAPTKLDLAEGEEIALIDAIKALITKSANDVAVAIAEHIVGSEEKFAKLMTQKARQLGMPATLFRNASGLPDDEQVTAARDMVTLALHLQDDSPGTTRSSPRAPSPTTTKRSTITTPCYPATRVRTGSRPAIRVRRGSTSSPPSAAAASTWWAPSSGAPAPRRATPRCAPS
jgi:D-alanyl-D-alanine carboxypeptidase